MGVGVGFTLAASSEREQAPRLKQQESEIAVRKIFMIKSERDGDVSLLRRRRVIVNPEKRRPRWRTGS